MKANIKIKYDIKELNELNKTFNDRKIVKIGILGNKNNRKDKGLTNSMIGSIHEFGSFEKNIPRRSFLKDTFDIKINEFISKTKDIISKNIKKKNAMKIIFSQVGIFGEILIQNAFETDGFGKWKPLSKKTIERKKSEKILVDTAQLRKSITSKVENI
jgi:phage gpG-like protein